MGFYLSEAQHIKKFSMNKKIIETLKKEITNLKNIIDSKETDVERLDSINKEHKKLNGRLRLETSELKLEKINAVEEAKKEADELMMNKISKYEKKIRRLKNDAKDLLNYP